MVGFRVRISEKDRFHFREELGDDLHTIIEGTRYLTSQMIHPLEDVVGEEIKLVLVKPDTLAVSLGARIRATIKSRVPNPSLP